MQQAPKDTLVTRLLPAHATGTEFIIYGQTKQFTDLRAGLEKIHKINDLTAEQQNLFNFLKLIVDIKYRHTYGSKIEQPNGKGYSTYDG